MPPPPRRAQPSEAELERRALLRRQGAEQHCATAADEDTDVDEEAVRPLDGHMLVGYRLGGHRLGGHRLLE